tara:strand:- start:198 stop:740 length:543 start_codon:yes stop_codon:yes gene_type:complete
MKTDKYIVLLSFLFAGLLFSCNTKVKPVSNQDTIENNVRYYFSMGDTVQLDIVVVDTVFVAELTAMQDNVSKNYNLAQMDIDTLDYAIEVWENKMFNIQDGGGSDYDINQAKVMLQMYQLNQTDTRIKQYNYKNSNRIFTNLQRSTKGKISGYEVLVTYKITGETNTFSLLLDATLRVVD